MKNCYLGLIEIHSKSIVFKMLVNTVGNYFWLQTSNLSFFKKVKSHLVLTQVLWKLYDLLVKIKAIVDLWSLVKRIISYQAHIISSRLISHIFFTLSSSLLTTFTLLYWNHLKYNFHKIRVLYLSNQLVPQRKMLSFQVLEVNILICITEPLF